MNKGVMTDNKLRRKTMWWMKLHRYRLNCAWLLLITLLSSSICFSQTTDSTRKELKTETINDLYLKSSQPFEEMLSDGSDTITGLLRNIQEKSIKLEELKSLLSERLDTLEMREAIPRFRNLIKVLQVSVKANAGQLNMRQLIGLQQMTNNMLASVESFNQALKKNYQQIHEVGQVINLLKSDTLYVNRTVNKSRFPVTSDEYTILETSVKEIEQRYTEQRITLMKYETGVSDVKIKLLELKNLANSQKSALVASYWNKEINYLWEGQSYSSGNWSDKMGQSILLNLKIIQLFIARSVAKIAILLLIILSIFFGIFLFFRNKVKQISNGSIILKRVNYFDKHPLWSAFALVIPLFWLVVNDPPMPFIALVSFLNVIVFLPLFREHFSKKLYLALLVSLPVYLFYAILALQWETVYETRWLQLFTSLYLVGLGYLVFSKSDEAKLKDTKDRTLFLKVVSVFLIAMILVSISANLLGRYNIAKFYAVAGVINFYRGIALYFFVQVCLEAIYLFMESFKGKNEKATSFIDYNELHGKLQKLLSVFAIGIWIHSILFYLGYLDPVVAAIKNFLGMDRTVGTVTFSFNSIILFAGILLLSFLLANSISYLTALRDQKATTARKNRIGSTVLLIRLAILTGGFLLAVAATKIPLDRITIVFGALSVGIGFGLQTIVNNLVSGIILAFEKPIQIGDTVQLGNVEGVVKDIGIRASKIKSWDGAEIIIPNGDFLSNHLTNWTLSDKKRRVELIIGVGYSSDVDVVTKLIETELNTDAILKLPAPRIFLQTFADSSINFRVLFWVEDVDLWSGIRDQVMRGIFRSFKENAIEIPFPQRDVHITNFPDPIQEKRIIPPV